MKKILITIFGFLSIISVAHASILGVQSGGTGASTLTGCLTGNGIQPITGTGSACGSGGGTSSSTPLIASTELWIDGNATTTIQSGSIQYPFHTIDAANAYVTASSGILASGATYHIAPTNYVELNSTLTMPNTALMIFAGKSTIITGYGAANGTINFPNQFSWNGGTILGSVTETDTSTSTAHSFEDDFAILGNINCSGLCTLLNGVQLSFASTTAGYAPIGATSTLTIGRGALANILGENTVASVVDNGGTLNLNDDQVICTTSSYCITATTTGSIVEVLGLTLINPSGGGINVQNGATITPNNLGNIIITDGVGATPIISNATTTTILNGYNAYSIIGQQQYAVGSGYIASDQIGLFTDGGSVLGSNVGGIPIGTTTIDDPFVASSTFAETNTATSTFAGSIVSPCFTTSTLGACITGGGGGGLASYNVSSTNPFISVSTTTTTASLTFSSSTLGLGSAAYLPSTNWLSSTTSYVANNSGDWAGTWQTHAPSYFQTALGFTPYNATNPSNYIPLTALSSSATGLTYTNTTGVFSLTSGYNIPLTASTTQWASAYASTTALSGTSPIVYTGSTGVISCPTCQTGSPTNYFTNSSASTTLNTGTILIAPTGTFGVINATTTATSTFKGGISANCFSINGGTCLSSGSGSGTIGGSITSGQIAFGSTTANAIKGTANATLDLSGDALFNGNVRTNGNIVTNHVTSPSDSDQYIKYSENSITNEIDIGDLGCIYGCNYLSMNDSGILSDQFSSFSLGNANLVLGGGASVANGSLSINNSGGQDSTFTVDTAGDLDIAPYTLKLGINQASPTTALDVNGDITDENVKSATCIGTNGTGKIISGACGGTNYFTNSGATTTLSTGSVLQATVASTSLLCLNGTCSSSFGGGSGITSLAGVTNSTITLNGTTNEVIVATTSNSISLSTPQAINTSSAVQFGTMAIGSALKSGYTTSIISTNSNLFYLHDSGASFARAVIDAGGTGNSSTFAFFAGGVDFWSFGKTGGNGDFGIVNDQNSVTDMTISSSTGNVGISTTTPATALDVNGNVTIEKANGIIMRDTVTGSCYIIKVTSGVLVPTASTTAAC